MRSSAELTASDRPWELASAAVVALLWLCVSLLPLRGIPRTTEDAPGLDAHIYIAMAESPAVFTMAPFGYRIGAPFLARALPLSLEGGFFTVTAVSLFVVLVLAYLLLRQWGFDHVLSLLGLSLLAAAPEVTRFLNNYFLVDPAGLVFITLLLLGIERQWSSGVMAFLLLVATLFKETAFFVLPVLYLRCAGSRLFDKGAATKTFLVAFPALVAALFLRFGWDGSPSRLPYITPWSAPRRAWFGTYDSYGDIWVNVFGYLGLLAVVNAFTAEGRSLVRRYWPYMVLVLLQLVLALDTDRLLFFSFPVVLPLALLELKRMKDSLADWFPFMGTLLVFCYLFLPGQLAVPLAIVVLARVLIEWRGARVA